MMVIFPLKKKKSRGRTSSSSSYRSIKRNDRSSSSMVRCALRGAVVCSRGCEFLLLLLLLLGHGRDFLFFPSSSKEKKRKRRGRRRRRRRRPSDVEFASMELEEIADKRKSVQRNGLSFFSFNRWKQQLEKPSSVPLSPSPWDCSTHSYSSRCSIVSSCRVYTVRHGVVRSFFNTWISFTGFYILSSFFFFF